MIELTQQMRKFRPPRSPAPGEFVGRYQILRRLGHGGGGEVFEAVDPRTGDEVALKTLRPDWAADRRRVQEFLEEAYTASCVVHPGVVRMRAWGRGGACIPFLAMDLLRGDPLSVRMARARLSIREVVRVLDGVLDALEAVHAAGVLHRDIKPGNVILARRCSDRERVTLVDFGLALRARSGSPRESRVSGTPAYMAPERMRGHRGTPKSDLYAVGALAYEMLSGAPPYGHEPPEIFEALGRKLAPADAEQPVLSRWVARLLAPSAFLRPSSASPVRSSLRQLARSGEIIGLAPRPPIRVARPLALAGASV
jgi:serine/threonine-protein kinase